MNNFHMPTRNEVESLSIGDVAPDAFGRMAPVVSIHGRGDDVNGLAFVCYCTDFGPGSKCSMSIKQDTLTRTAGTSAKHTSAELDAIERQMRAERA